MEPTGRLYLCARCRVQVMICSRCDRGQRYCAGECATLARREAQRAAGRRYQQSRRGRFSHAARQKRYRQRRSARENVTHQGSAPVRHRALLPPRPPVPVSEAFQPRSDTACGFCTQPLSDFLRSGFRRGRDRQRR